jgi:PTS system fructose-specific IIA component/PTS system nitrogen regulatory IIA component
MKLCEFAVKEAIIPALSATDKEGVIREMVGSLHKANCISPSDQEGIIAAILRREELGSTGIGRGVAIPHTKHGSVARSTLMLAIAPQGIDFASLDGDPVHVLVLLVSPPEQPGDHLRLLETITRHLNDDDFRRFLRQSRTIDDIWEILREMDARLG